MAWFDLGAMVVRVRVGGGGGGKGGAGKTRGHQRVMGNQRSSPAWGVITLLRDPRHRPELEQRLLSSGRVCFSARSGRITSIPRDLFWDGVFINITYGINKLVPPQRPE